MNLIMFSSQLLDDKAAELSVEEMFLVKIKLQETAQQFKVSFGFEALHAFGEYQNTFRITFVTRCVAKVLKNAREYKLI